MEAASLDIEFWENVKQIKKQPSEYRKSQFMQVVEGYKAGVYDLNTILVMSEVLGAGEGKLWFREAVPLYQP